MGSVYERHGLSCLFTRVQRPQLSGIGRYFLYILKTIALCTYICVCLTHSATASESEKSVKSDSADETSVDMVIGKPLQALGGKRLFFAPEERHGTNDSDVELNVIQRKATAGKTSNNNQDAVAALPDTTSKRVSSRASVLKPRIRYNALIQGARATHIIVNSLPCEIERVSGTDLTEHGERVARKMHCPGNKVKSIRLMLLHNGRDIAVFNKQIRLGVVKPGHSLQ